MKGVTYPFNNSVETGLRILAILTAVYPGYYGIDHLICFDYMVVHSGDIDQDEASLHPAVPNRNGEIFVRRSLIGDSLGLLREKGLVAVIYGTDGIGYQATESAAPFLDALSSSYIQELLKKAAWLSLKFYDKTISELHAIFDTQSGRAREEFNFEII